MFKHARPAIRLMIGMLCFLSAQSLLPAQNSVDPGPFYGFWQMQEPAGDQCVVNIKRGGRASCFYIGSASSEVTKGRWAIEGDSLTISWENGHRDVFKAWGDGTLQRQAFLKGESSPGQPTYETRAMRIDPRMPGSLTVDSAPGDRADTPAPSRRLPTTDAGEPAAPMRNPYIGYWMVEQSPGMFFGLIGDSTDRFYLFLDRNGRASVALRSWDDGNTVRGRWEFVDGEARITWPSGRKDALVKDPKGGFRLRSFGRKDTFADKPNERREARQSTPTEAAQYFNSGDVRLLTMTDIRGVWAPGDPAVEDQRLVHIMGWGNAQLKSPETGEPVMRGTWKLFNDHVVVTWDDGSKDVLRSNMVYWVRDHFPIGEAVTGAPAYSTHMVKVAEDAQGL